MIPFPNLFPPPEIWDKIPPLSDRRRQIGMLREAGILAAAGIAVVGLALMGVSKGMDKLNDPAWQVTDRDKIIDECTIAQAASRNSAGFVLRIMATEVPIGTEKEENFGPAHGTLRVASAGSPSIFGDGLRRPLGAAAQTGVNEYEFDTSRLPDGPATYTVYFNHDVSFTSFLGPIQIAAADSVVYDHCGKVALDVHGGAVGRVSVVEQ